MITAAIVGCGRICENAHLPALSQLDNVRIKYACDIIEEKAQKMKERFPKIENVITDYNVALNDPDVDAVCVLTPNYAHYTVTMDALKKRQERPLREADYRKLSALRRDG